MRLKNKLIGLCTLIILCFVAFIVGYFLPNYKVLMMKQKVVQLESTATQLVTMIETMDKKGLPRDQIIKIIKDIRYGTDGREYVLLLNGVGFCEQHPTTESLDGKDVSQVKDPLGFPLVQEYLKIANTTGKGSILYHWPWFNDKTRIEPKMAYVYNYKKLDLLVIATAYINDVEDAITHLRNVALLIMTSVSMLALFLSWLIIKNVLKSITNLRLRLQELNDDNDGSLSRTIP